MSLATLPVWVIADSYLAAERVAREVPQSHWGGPHLADQFLRAFHPKGDGYRVWKCTPMATHDGVIWTAEPVPGLVRATVAACLVAASFGAMIWATGVASLTGAA